MVCQEIYCTFADLMRCSATKQDIRLGFGDGSTQPSGLLEETPNSCPSSDRFVGNIKMGLLSLGCDLGVSGDLVTLQAFRDKASCPGWGLKSDLCFGDGSAQPSGLFFPPAYIGGTPQFLPFVDWFTFVDC